MNEELLTQIGLTQSQAKVYLALIQNGESTAPKVAELSKESRTNAYMILEKLESLGLIEKVPGAKKLTYQPLNPTALEKLAEENTHKVAEAEESIKRSMPQLLSYFYTFTEKPGIRLLQGEQGLREIYQDTLREKKDIYFLRTPAETDALGAQFFHQYKKRRAFLGITTYAYTQDTETGRRNVREDGANKIVRSWIEQDDYTAPVEIDVYGDKTAFLAFGDEFMGVIIQSPYIAESMRQMMRMIGTPEVTSANITSKKK